MDFDESFFKLKVISWALKSRQKISKNRTQYKMGDAGK
jgi:hypothetical protein